MNTDLLLCLALLESSGAHINQCAIDAIECAIEHYLRSLE
jgi:hypothetical protein